MSVESAKAFIERMQTDEAFAKKINEAKDKEERIALRQAEGFVFSAEEFEQATGDLSDEELYAVVGGGSFGYVCTSHRITGRA